MKNLNFKSLIPIISAIVIFVVLTMGYFSPVLKGKALQQSDIVSHKGISKEAADFREKYNQEPLWTNSLFGGMPLYQISTLYPNNYVQHIHTLFSLGLPHPVNAIFIALIGFFILLRILKVDPWLSIAGAIAFAFSAYLFTLIEAGHNSKTLAIAYMPLVFAGIVLLFRKKYLLGGALTALFLSLEIFANHLQMTYYLFLFLGFYFLVELYQLIIKEKAYKDAVKIIATLLVAVALSFGPNAANLWTTSDYVKYTIRGKSELTADKDNKTTGVDKDYATQWSMGKAETMTLMIPGFKGRSSSFAVGENKKALKGIDQQMKDSIANTPQYWGDQPFTSSPYAGAIVIFLFVLGLFIVEGRLKWVIVITTLFSVLLSWGRHFMPLTEFFLDYFPVYNKFRAVSTILIIAEFTIPILAVLAIDKIIKNPDYFKQKIKLAFVKTEINVKTAFIISFALTGGLSLLFYLMPGLTDFFAEGEYDKIYNQVAQSNGADIAQKFMDNIETARISLFKADAIRSFFFILLGAAAVWLLATTKMNKILISSVIGLLIFFDLFFVDRGYVNDKNFKSKQEVQVPFPMTNADKEILQDKDPNYRVLNLAVNTFNDASTSYYHKSVGGYHAAKLRRYQEMIENHITKNMQNIIGTLNSNPSDSALRATFEKQGVLNMLNTKYIIYNPEAAPLQNRYALGNAWFVNDIKMVKNADEEIKTVGEINPLTTAVVDERFKDEVAGFKYNPGAPSSIKLTEYLPNNLKYECSSDADQVAVFSEIYYPDGWKVTVDGNEASHFRVNYILRAMKVPAGKHTIEFKFEPKQYYTGQKVALASSILLIMVVLGALFVELKGKPARSEDGKEAA